jgi:serralysin
MIDILDGLKSVFAAPNDLTQLPLGDSLTRLPDRDQTFNPTQFKSSSSLPDELNLASASSETFIQSPSNFGFSSATPQTIKLDSFTQTVARSEIESNPSPSQLNSFVAESFGWLNNNIDNFNAHNLSSAAMRCRCPACSGISPTDNTRTQGTFQKASAPVAATASLSGDYQIDSLLSGYKWGFSWGSQQLTYSFYDSTVFNGAYYGSETGVKSVSDAVKANVRSMMNWISTVINVDLVEVAETSSSYGRIRIMNSNNPSYAYAYYPSSDTMASVTGDVHLNPNYDRLGDTNGFQNPAGKHGYCALIHEIGHALGLKHSFDGSTVLPSGEDKQTNTVMTYTFDSNEPGTFMRYDVKALQYLYGARSYNTGDTAYQFTSRVDQFSVNGQLPVNTSYSTKLLIWDGGGLDTLDFSQLASNSSGYRFDLAPGGLLSLQSSYTSNTISFGTEIAYNVTIENLINSSSADTIYLNSAANNISGYTSQRVTGNDVIWNATAQDVLDLSGYNTSAVTQTQSGSDLVLGLGTNGSITVKNYFSGSNLNLLFGDGGDSLSLSIGDISLQEGNSGTTNAVFTVSLSGASSKTVTVNYATANGTAIADSDYTATSGILTFNPGETSKTVSVQVVGDTLSESNETFSVNLSGATNASIADSQGMGTIQDDDITLSINDVSVTEGNSSTKNAAFTVSLSKASSQTITVQYATANGTAIAGSDYRSLSGTLTFNPGQTSKTVNVRVIGDKIVESNESFSVNLSSAVKAVIADSQGIGTVTNDDTASALSSRQQNSLLSMVGLLAGSSGADRFVLGDKKGAYYNTQGNKDYGSIADFQASQGDSIQLYGSAADYRLAPSTGSLPGGTAIFFNSGESEELVGLVQGATNLNLNSNAFSFVA